MPSTNGRRGREELARLQTTVREIQERLRQDRARRETVTRRLSETRLGSDPLRRERVG